jgi:uncharacterized protein (DUF433 family)
MDWRKYIHSDFNIMMGKPVIKGTRITVELVLEKVAAGEGFEQIIAEHPRLTRNAILAAVAFAAENLRADVIYPVSKAA